MYYTIFNLTNQMFLTFNKSYIMIIILGGVKVALDKLRRKRVEKLTGKESKEYNFNDYSIEDVFKKMKEIDDFGKGSSNNHINTETKSDIDIIKNEESDEKLKQLWNNNSTTKKENTINNEEKINEITKSINKKITLLNDRINNLYNSEEIINEGKIIKEKLDKNSNLSNKNLNDLMQIDSNLNKLIHDVSILETKAEEMKQKDEILINNSSILIDDYLKFTQRMKQKYGDKFVILFNEEEEKRFIELRSKAYNISKASVMNEIENAINMRYNEIVGNKNSNMNNIFENKPMEKYYEQEKRNNEIKKENLKKEIEIMDIEIKEILDYFTPYLNIPKVNEQITKVKEKLNEVDTSEIIDSLTDYIRVKEIKTNILDYLHKAQDFIMSKSTENQSL